MKRYAVIGLGYVGLGLVVALGKKNHVFGYDNNQERIQELQQQEDRNKLVDKSDLTNSTIVFTSKIEEIKQANFYIVVVPTPAYFYEIPNLDPLINATKTLASVLKKQDIIVYESTVYPGVTENVCIPILEKYSNLKNGVDFHVGYSPEKVNPGDSNHVLTNITKIIAAQNEKTLRSIQETYQSICEAVHPVSNIKTAEAIKLLENVQRDVNIALMNEFSQIMHALQLNMHEIIEGAKTKWNFIPYQPGFVGGHCISIDPHYLAFEAKQHGIYPELILTARKVNDGMTQYVIQSLLKLLVTNKVNLREVTIGVFGVTYKENVGDIRNSLALKLIKELQGLGVHCRIHDPIVNCSSTACNLESFDQFKDLSVVIITVAHDFYREIGLEKILSICKNPKIIMDIPNLFVNESHLVNHVIYWSL